VTAVSDNEDQPDTDPAAQAQFLVAMANWPRGCSRQSRKFCCSNQNWARNVVYKQSERNTVNRWSVITGSERDEGHLIMPQSALWRRGMLAAREASG